jgi:sugar (pentulose or hexulose) kinase
VSGATAVLDVGKTNIKLALFSPDGALLWERSQPNPVRSGPPYPHADVEAIWAFYVAALGDANRAHPIEKIVPTAHGATAALVDDEGLVLPVMDYEYARIDEIEDRYRTLRPPFSESLSPKVPLGLNLGRQIAYQAWRYPDEFARARALLMYPQYWSWRLTGIAALEATSLGAHTDLWRPREGTPSSLFAALGLDRIAPPLRQAWETLGPIRPDLAAQTGIDAMTPVLCGIHDSNASLVPHLISRAPPFTVISTGTWVILMGVGVSLDALDPASDMLANIDVYGRPTACGRYMGGREYANLAPLPGPASPDVNAVVRLIARNVLPVPCFSSGGGPFAGRKGEVRGAIKEEERPALATLYSALMTDLMLTRLNATQGDLLIEGSFASNATLRALLAELRPAQHVIASIDSAGTARGAALLAHWPAKFAAKRETPTLAADVPGLEHYRVRWLQAVNEA